MSCGAARQADAKGSKSNSSNTVAGLRQEGSGTVVKAEGFVFVVIRLVRFAPMVIRFLTAPNSISVI